MISCRRHQENDCDRHASKSKAVDGSRRAIETREGSGQHNCELEPQERLGAGQHHTSLRQNEIDIGAGRCFLLGCDDLDPEGDDGIRIWTVGCATGEEAYSIAILVHEEAARRKLHPRVQIFASDLDEGALATAREGRYPRSIEADVSEERLARFFTDEGTHYRVRKEVRESVLFSKHSVIKDPPFMRLDLIACRNLLIYLERAMQQQLHAVFHYCLRPGRYLFLGSAETADSAAELFAPLDRDARIYCARHQTTQLLPVMPFSTPERLALPTETIPTRADNTNLTAAMHLSALEQIAPPTALVDDMHNVLHFSPSVGRFILHSGGTLSNNLPAIVRPELRLDLAWHWPALLIRSSRP
ncbi:CheR family methyltransferase [Rhizobium sp. Root708]|uniref:CheR family methyltransferase n=1 Tax=Rhizobium sp. Root708 TaxID=1736592 RepID=UPI003FD69EEA